MMSNFDVADVAFSRDFPKIKTIFLIFSITFYPRYFVPSIISCNKVDNIGLIT